MFIFLVFSFFRHSGELKVNKLKIETSILTGIYQEVIVTGGKMGEKIRHNKDLHKWIFNCGMGAA